MFEISGRHVLVTGGSSGLGRHFARFLANNGAHVTLAARRAEALAANVGEINASGGQAQSVVLDVTLADGVDSALKEAEGKFGPIQARLVTIFPSMLMARTPRALCLKNRCAMT